MRTEKYQGIFCAFYACYDENGRGSAERTQALARYLLDKRGSRTLCGRLLR